jgi:hypothetical protein
MKKIVTFILPVVLFMYACNNGGESKTTTPIDPIVSQIDTPIVSEPEPVDGAPVMPAQVFDDVTLKPIQGAVIAITDSANGRSAGSATTNESGLYSINTLTAGKKYKYVCSKANTTYVAQTKYAVYENANSLPGFNLNKPK